VRIDLRAQCFQLRFGQQPAEPLFAQVLRALLLFEVDGIPSAVHACADGIQESELLLHQRARLVTGRDLEAKAGAAILFDRSRRQRGRPRIRADSNPLGVEAQRGSHRLQGEFEQWLSIVDAPRRFLEVPGRRRIVRAVEEYPIDQKIQRANEQRCAQHQRRAP
jgi:hypothetical protein